jgi:50S ribosomal protein L4
MQIDVVNQQNEKVGSVDLRDEVFGGRVKTDLIHASVVRSNAADRRGTHATKNRALVSGSGKKPWRQKGTGRARVGEIRNPLWRKGGTVFGPQPRSYDYQLPKKVEKGALRAALAEKLQAGAVTVVDALSVSEVKTKAAIEMLRKLGVEGGRKGKALLVDVKPEEDHRRHPQAPNHGEDDGHPRGWPHARVPGGDGRQQDRHQARRRTALRLEGRKRPHLARARQDEAAGPLRRPALGLEEGLREAAGRGEGSRNPAGCVARGSERAVPERHRLNRV